MISTVRKTLRISAAHHIVGHQNPDGSPGKCARPHGHNYTVEVYARGPLDDLGMVVDFYDLKQAMKKVIDDPCDHQDLNEVYGALITTAENLAIVWLTQIRELVPQVFRVVVWETEDSAAEASIEPNLWTPNPGPFNTLVHTGHSTVGVSESRLSDAEVEASFNDPPDYTRPGFGAREFTMPELLRAKYQLEHDNSLSMESYLKIIDIMKQINDLRAQGVTKFELTVDDEVIGVIDTESSGELVNPGNAFNTGLYY